MQAEGTTYAAVIHAQNKGLLALLLHDFDVVRVTHHHPEQRVAGRFDSSGDSDHFPLEILSKSKRITEQVSNKLATIPELNVVAKVVSPVVKIRPCDRSDLELHRDNLLRHQFDGFFGGQHLLLLLASIAARCRILLRVWLLLRAVL